MLKSLPPTYIKKITLLINNIFKYSCFPLYWKTALTAPILKSSKALELPTSHRFISLLNSLSKVTEAFIAKELNTHNYSNNIMSTVQFGFRERLPARHQVYRLVEHITMEKI